MSEQPPEGRPAGPGGRGQQGKKILGMSRPQAIGLGLVALGGLAYLLYRARKNAEAAAAQSSTAGSCPDGSTPDANGNCPQNSTDFSGQLGTLQDEIGQLQQELAGVGSGSGTGTGGSPPPPTGVSPPPTGGSPPPVSYPQNQTGTVTSATTGRQAKVTTSDGGDVWTYAGVTLTAAEKAAEPKNQTGVVFSNTTQKSGKVATTNGGQTWNYEGVPSAT